MRRPDCLYAGDPGFPGKAGINNRYDQFAPRVGLAWDPEGNGKMSIRASFGMSYDFPNVMIYSTESTAPPFGDQITVTGPEPFATPFANSARRQFLPCGFQRQRALHARRDFRRRTAEHEGDYDLQLEPGRSTAADTNSWFVSATYAGTETAHLWVSYQLNPAVIVPNIGWHAAGNLPQGRDRPVATPRPTPASGA